ETLQHFLKQIRERAGMAGPDSLDDVRALLIQCGQLEQAVSDSGLVDAQWQAHFQQVTNNAAHAFFSAYVGEHVSAINVDDELINVRRRLSRDVPFDAELSIKVPEGYEFYALYPEQYCESARRWLDEHRSAKSALVAGIRSIGTSLS